MSPTFSFRVLHTDGAARRGEMTTAHGLVQTPAFMPVGTRGAVKGMTPRDLREAGAEIILGNTYHLWLRPGDGLIARLGGLHRFIGLGRAHPDRQRGIPGLQPRRATRHHGGRDPVPVPSGWQRAHADAGGGHRHPGAARPGHRDGARRVPGPAGAVVGGARVHGALGPLGPPMPRPLPAAGRNGACRRWSRRQRTDESRVPSPGPVPGHQPRPGAVRDHPGRDRSRTPHAERRTDAGHRVRGLRHRRPQRRRARRQYVRSRRATRRLSSRPTARATSWAWARRSTSWKRSRAASTSSTASCPRATPATASCSRARAA